MIYRIKIAGVLDQSWSDWLGYATIISESQKGDSIITTLVVNLIDQSALFGILDRIRDLNLVLVDVAKDDNEQEKAS